MGTDIPYLGQLNWIVDSNPKMNRYEQGTAQRIFLTENTGEGNVEASTE